MMVSSKVSLHFRGEKLADMDTFSKSDPFLVLYERQPGGRLNEVGRTETIADTLNPAWKRSILTDFFFETRQSFVAKVWDYDGKAKDEENDHLGTFEFDLAHVVSSRGQTRSYPLSPGGKIIVTATEISVPVRDTIQLQFFGKRLKKMDTFGLCDPYLKIFRLLPDNSTRLIATTPVCKNTLEPSWPLMPLVKLVDLAGKELTEKTIRVEGWDEDLVWDDSMGFFDCSVADLLQCKADGRPFILSKPEKPGKMYGEIYVKEAAIQHFPSFLEMLNGGMQINMAVSIDFTGSNGDPRQPNSLHFMGNPTQPNQYVRAIGDVSRILLDYDTDKMVAAFGFGATLPSGETSHFFHLNMQPNPYVPGVEGILAAYQSALMSIRLSGPTNFAPTIVGATTGARSAPGVYTILLIITDGEITDMDDTINAIVAADDAPLSIVIVGVGKGSDFVAMDTLDGDNEPLKNSSGRVTRRDLVQFVPMREFTNKTTGELAAAVLAEVPRQVEEWWTLQQRSTAGNAPPPPGARR